MPSTPINPRPWRPAMQETRAYNHLFSLVDRDLGDIAARDAVWPLLQKSGIHFAYLSKIWQLVDSNGQGQMSRRQFHVAMKLVSMAQAGRPLMLENLGDATALPVFEGVEPQSAIDNSSRSSLLRYSPQPTFDVDEIIASASASSTSSSPPSIVSKRSASPPTLSRSSSVFLASSADLLDVDRVAMVTPQLMHFSPARVCSQPPAEAATAVTANGALHIDTSMHRLPERSHETSKSDWDQYSELSTDSITELLSQIDQMVSTSRTTQRSSTSASTASMEARRELEEKMAQLQKMCEQELAMNASLADRLHIEEAQILELSGHIERAQSNIAYVAWQRAQLVDRLQKVEVRQREATQRMEEAERETVRCTEDVTMLDNKMFAMERRQVQILRRTKHMDGGYSPNARSSVGSMSSAENVVMSRYESAKRNRLSSVFRSNAGK
ncbi:hypothetical protein GGF42_005901 [Coemansia sp. RSA 2424]|nr:hypothetical protein GGF42_005901 [Coemansia sp. RSA 2424]